MRAEVARHPSRRRRRWRWSPSWPIASRALWLALFVLFKVTGIPPTEAQALASRADYRDYQQTTSVFVPWFPKKRARQ